MLLAGIYTWHHYAYYGLNQGDSYIFDLSPRIVNTLTWYGLWSLGLPEMLVDFIGPGLKINPNLIRFWGKEIIAIVLVFGALLLQIIYFMAKKPGLKIFRTLVFSFLWFGFTLGPILLLPWHKFSFYLTIPMFSVALFLAALIGQFPKLQILLFLGTLLLITVLTLNLTVRTNWISKGLVTAKNVDTYLRNIYPATPTKTTIVFYDTPVDKQLPWSPAGVLKDVLSDNNYFRSLCRQDLTAEYVTEKPDKIIPGRVLIEARQFLGY